MSYPKYVNIQAGTGIEKMFFSELIDHERKIIADNILSAFKSNCSAKEVQDYDLQAERELKVLKKVVKDNPDVVLRLDSETERYVVA